MARFDLTKWYMDCLTPDGRALVAYSADLRWRGPTIAYENALEVDANGVRSRSSLSRHAGPVQANGRATWRSPRLHIEAQWEAGARAIEETIYREDPGSIVWRCLIPSGKARATTRHGALDGWGYVECLRMTVAPWRLPIQTLRWGHVSAPDQAIVWIEWRGDFSASIVYDDGRRVAAPELADDRLILADGTAITLDRRTIVRDGLVGSALAKVPGLRRRAAARMLLAHECKWLSRATIERPGCPAAGAWAIHEVVEWPQPVGR